MAAQAARWDLKDADAAPEIALNRAIWKSVKGRRSRMPLPRHDLIVGSAPNDEAEGPAAPAPGDGRGTTGGRDEPGDPDG